MNEITIGYLREEGQDRERGVMEEEVLWVGKDGREIVMVECLFVDGWVR